MTSSRSLLLLVALWLPAVLVGLVLDRRDDQPEWWIVSGALTVYAMVAGAIWWLLTQRRPTPGSQA